MSEHAPKIILVVDDETFMHVFMQHHLARAGYKVLAARNGREGLEKAAAENPDLIVMDIMMEEMDGLSALRELKGTEATRGIPVIMITTSAQTLTRQESEASGAALFMTKPFSPTQLLLEIKRLLGD
jgi:two-component system chemotaxis response regulator CheY